MMKFLAVLTMFLFVATAAHGQNLNTQPIQGQASDPLGVCAPFSPTVSQFISVSGLHVSGNKILNGQNPAFWTSVANTFKSRSTVIFDLFNEPWPDNNGDTTAAWTCLLNGGTCPGVSYTAVGTQTLVNTIRATGSTNIIMVPGVQYTNVLDQWLNYKPVDPLGNIAASWHSYYNQICISLDCWNGVIAPILASDPLIAGEIGEGDCQGVYINPLMNWLDAHGGNYLGWAWNTYDCSGFPSLISDYSGIPTALGANLRDHLLGLVGLPIPTPPPIAMFAQYLTGTWVNVTPANASPTGSFACGNYGDLSVGADPNNQSNIYIQYNCQGVWKSTDYGQTWTGPINTGVNGPAAGDCAGNITLASAGAGNPPIIYEACIRSGSTPGANIGLWKSVNGGVDWTHINIPVAPSDRQDIYAVVVDPYNPNHIVCPAHEYNGLYESHDGGTTWSSMNLAGGMLQSGGTAEIFFIDTGNAATTATTFLYQAQGSGGGIGTWRTTNDGASWTKVDSNEHPHGAGQIYQPDSNGTVYAAGIYSALGWGVLKSTDYGVTWTHVGNTGQTAIVWGTPNAIYSGMCCGGAPGFQFNLPPGSSNWYNPTQPAGMAASGPGQSVTVFDGVNYVTIIASWQSGTWRLVEDSFGIAVGNTGTTPYLASDWTLYYPDVPSDTLLESMQFFTAYTTTDTITGTPDTALYTTGKSGGTGTWTINVPNANYNVTLGIAPTVSGPNAGPYGQDVYIQSTKVGTCVWSSASGPTGCPFNVVPSPTPDVAITATYSVSVFNQNLLIQPAASEGGGRQTMLNTIKVQKTH
jgi:hypothetical protein